MRVLVVEDEASLSQQLSARADRRRAMPSTARPTANVPISLRERKATTRCVLDLGLPRVDGLTVLRGWRSSGLTIPVLVLTARGSWHETVQGIDEGADDYVVEAVQDGRGAGQAARAHSAGRAGRRNPRCAAAR